MNLLEWIKGVSNRALRELNGKKYERIRLMSFRIIKYLKTQASKSTTVLSYRSIPISHNTDEINENLYDEPRQTTLPLRPSAFQH